MLRPSLLLTFIAFFSTFAPDLKLLGFGLLPKMRQDTWKAYWAFVRVDMGMRRGAGRGGTRSAKRSGQVFEKLEVRTLGR